MKTSILKKTEIEIAAIRLQLPVRYGDEDIPYDFPLRDGEMWNAVVNIDTGRIKAWPFGETGQMHMKVCDSGVYTLLAPDGSQIVQLSDYVPHGVVPGEYGDYVELEIDENGVITNWPKSPDVSAFFEEAV